MFDERNLEIFDELIPAEKNRRGEKSIREKKLASLLKHADGVAEFNNISEGIVQLSACFECRGIIYGPNDDDYEGSFQINIKPQDGLCHYKSDQCIGGRKNCEKRIYFAATYYWKRNGKKWTPELLLADEAHLLGTKVKEAFVKWSQYTHDQINGDISLKEVDILVKDCPRVTTVAWVMPAVTVEGENVFLLVLVDNGKMLRLTPAELNFQDKVFENGKALKTKFNFFHLNGVHLSR